MPTYGALFCLPLSEACLFACRCIKGEPAIEEYYEMYSDAEKYGTAISEKVMQTTAAQQSLSPGRVVVVKSTSVSSYLYCILVFQYLYNLDSIKFLPYNFFLLFGLCLGVGLWGFALHVSWTVKCWYFLLASMQL